MNFPQHFFHIVDLDEGYCYDCEYDLPDEEVERIIEASEYFQNQSK